MLNTIFADIGNALKAFTLGDFLDILLVAFILYSFFRLIKDTKAYQMAIGLGIVLLLFLVSQWANLIVTQRIIRSFITYLIIAVIILFQGELRRFLTSIGSRSFKKHPSFKSLIEKSEEILLAIEYLSIKKIGALIAFEKEVSLNSYAKRGTEIDAVLSKDLLVSLLNWVSISRPEPAISLPWGFLRRLMQLLLSSLKKQGQSLLQPRETWKEDWIKNN